MSGPPPTDTLEALFLAAARRGSAERLLTVADVAEALRVEAAWVYEHAAELGALRLGAGSRAPIRFEARALAACVRELDEAAARPLDERRQVKARRGRSAGRRSSAAELLPVRGRLVDAEVAEARHA